MGKTNTAIQEEKEKQQDEEAQRKLLDIKNNAEKNFQEFAFKSSNIKFVNTPILIHPMPLLSIADHYSRTTRAMNKRVIGCLLGEISNDSIHITNCFGIPFEESKQHENVWYVDTTFLTNMYRMFHRINAKEICVGWYSTSPTINPNDIEIHNIFKEYTKDPIFLIVDVTNDNMPVQPYLCLEPLKDAAKQIFTPAKYSLELQEAEEVAIEHLLRDSYSDYESYSLGKSLLDVYNSLNEMDKKIPVIIDYLSELLNDFERTKSTSASLIYNKLQQFFNNFPQISDPEKLQDALNEETDTNLTLTFIGYASQLVGSLHNLIDNKKKIKL